MDVNDILNEKSLCIDVSKLNDEQLAHLKSGLDMLLPSDTQIVIENKRYMLCSILNKTRSNKGMDMKSYQNVSDKPLVPNKVIVSPCVCGCVVFTPKDNPKGWYLDSVCEKHKDSPSYKGNMSMMI